MSALPARSLLSGATLLLLLAVPAANAQFVFFPDDTTFDASNPLPPPANAVIGFANFDDYINGANPTSPTIRIVTGGDVSALEVHNSSLVNMSDGSVGSSDFLGELLATDTSIITISGGNVRFDVDLQHASTVNFSGGTISNNIVTHDNASVNMSGGTVEQDLLINGESIFNLSGGSIIDEVFVQDSSLLNIFGTGLSSVLIDPNFQDFYSQYALSGRLLDNTNLAGRIIYVQNDSGARFTLNNSISAVPEPGVFTFLMGASGCGLSLFLRRKKPFPC